MTLSSTHMNRLTEDDWQTLPGAAGARIRVLLKPPNIISSNTAVVVTPEGQALVVDPGGTAERAGEIEALLQQGLGEVQGAASRSPITALLTHAHYDHFAALDHLHRPVLLHGHAEAHLPLMNCDIYRTQAWFSGISLSPRPVDGPWLTEETQRTALPEAPGGWMCETRSFGSLDVVAYPVPGHSPCSTLLRIGDVLWMGDLPFAVDPGLVGLGGWDAQALAHSLRHALWLLEREPHLICCPGHGRLQSAAEMAATLRAMQGRLDRLQHVERLTPQRMGMLREHAQCLLHEAGRHFTIIAGQVMVLADRLEQLEEHDSAAEVLATLDADRIERELQGLQTFSSAFESGQRLETQLVMKACATMDKVERLLAQGSTPGLPGVLTMRTARLLRQFQEMAIGLRHLPPSQPIDLHGALRKVIATYRPPLTEGDGLAWVDEPARFTDMLIAGLARQSRVSSINFCFEGQAQGSAPDGMEMIEADTDEQSLLDAMGVVIEVLAVAVPGDTLHLAGSRHGPRVRVAIRAPGVDTTAAFDGRTLRLWRGMLNEYDGLIECDGDTVHLDLPAAAGTTP
jgi:glyoxylase-like metal-dependent hydrolase (beta-lactamase superfamily II)